MASSVKWWMMTSGGGELARPGVLRIALCNSPSNIASARHDGTRRSSGIWKVSCFGPCGREWLVTAFDVAMWLGIINSRPSHMRRYVERQVMPTTRPYCGSGVCSE